LLSHDHAERLPSLIPNQAKPALATRGFQIAVVDYDDADDLKFALRGIDTVISTVTGPNQILLIKAAVSARVRRFAPAEFEGLPQLRPDNDPLDRQRTNALQWLRHFKGSIHHTVFACGIFYERFQPGGLPRALIASNTGYHGEGSYIMDCAKMTAESPALGPSNQPDVFICMTSIRDVARFVTKAIDLPTWPLELRMCGERVTVHNLTILVQRLRSKMDRLEKLVKIITKYVSRSKVPTLGRTQPELPACRICQRCSARRSATGYQAADAYCHS
jgi:hypothetical protein